MKTNNPISKGIKKKTLKEKYENELNKGKYNGTNEGENRKSKECEVNGLDEHFTGFQR